MMDPTLDLIDLQKRKKYPKVAFHSVEKFGEINYGTHFIYPSHKSTQIVNSYKAQSRQKSTQRLLKTYLKCISNFFCVYYFSK